MQGIVFAFTRPGATFIQIVGFPGEILMRMLRALVLPLIFCSIVCAIARLSGEGTGKVSCDVSPALTTRRAVGRQDAGVLLGSDAAGGCFGHCDGVAHSAWLRRLVAANAVADQRQPRPAVWRHDAARSAV